MDEIDEHAEELLKIDFNDIGEGEAAKLKEGTKNDEEIEKLVLADDLSKGDKLLILLKSENLAQKSALLYLFPKYLEEFENDIPQQDFMVDQVFESVSNRVLASFGTRNNDDMEALQSISDMVSKVRSLHSRRIAVDFLLTLANKQSRAVPYGNTKNDGRSTLRSILEVLENIVLHSTCSLETMISLLDIVFERTLEGMDCMENSEKRMLSTYLLATLVRCRYFTSQADQGAEKTQRVIASFLNLFQDIDVEVRVCVCLHQIEIAQMIGPEKFTSMILPEYLELIKDEELTVRIAALKSLGSLVLSLPESVVKERLLPLYLKVAASEEAKGVLRNTPKRAFGDGESSDELFSSVVASIIGPIIYSTKSFAKTQLGEEGSLLLSLLDFYSFLSSSANAEVRRLCAYNWPAILHTIGGANYAKHLHDVAESLFLDEASKVRFVMASSLHEVADILGKPRMVRYIAPLVLPSLLSDRVHEVKSALLEHFPQIIASLAVADDALRKETFATIQKSVFEYMLPGPTNLDFNLLDWRFRIRCIEMLRQVHSYFDPVHVDEYFVPLLFKIILDGVDPLRMTATKTLAWVMKENSVTKGKVHIIHDLKAELCRGRSWSLRKQFVYFCECASEYLDHAFVTKYRLADAILDLLDDKVANVRLEVCQRMPAFVRNGVFRTKDSIEALERAITQDVDRDVREYAKTSIEEIVSRSANGTQNEEQEEKISQTKPHNSSTTKPSRQKMDVDIPRTANKGTKASVSGSTSAALRSGKFQSGKMSSRARPPTTANSSTSTPSPRARQHLKQ